MAQTFEYILNLQDKVSGKLKLIGNSSESFRNTITGLQDKTNKYKEALGGLGYTMSTLQQKISLLKNEREIIPLDNLNTIRKYNIEIKRLEAMSSKIGSLNGGMFKKWTGELTAAIPQLNLLKNPLTIIAASVYGLSRYVAGSTDAYKNQAVAETKLTQVMRNTMGASDSEIESIKKLTSAQQKLGVISDNVQLSGAQELSTYLTKKNSIEKLLPAMNDMLAQQYGLDASSEQAINIASMMGKVMDGQVGALSRYGYKFSEAQEKVLKFGTESQRAATLFDVIKESVGGVNEALAQTPEGKLKKAANEAQDLQERVGNVWTKISAAWVNVAGTIEEKLGKIVGWVEKNIDAILAIVSVVAKGVTFVIDKITGAFGWLINKFKEGNPVIIGIAVAIGLVATSLLIYNSYLALATLFQNKLTFAVIRTNLAFLANPVMWVIAGIVALIAIIGYVIYAYDGWGEAWDNLMTGLKYTWKAFASNFKLIWMAHVDAFMKGLELIERGWYRVKGLWDKDGANAGLAKLNDEAEKRSREIAYQKGLTETYNKMAGDAYGKIGLKRNDKTFSGMMSDLKNKIMPGGIPGANGKGGGGAGGKDLSDTGIKTNEAIATGGTKNTTIHINIGKQIESLTVMTSNIQEGATKIRDIIVDEMTRAIAMSGAMAN